VNERKFNDTGCGHVLT